jgi:hypothetical protein
MAVGALLHLSLIGSLYGDAVFSVLPAGRTPYLGGALKGRYVA